MTTVPAREFYEFCVSNQGKTVECEECGKEMRIPNTENLNARMNEPFWVKEKVETYIGGNYDKFHSYCEEHCQTTLDWSDEE